MKRALIVVDLQNDFMPGGALPVPEGDQVIPAVRLITRKFDFVVASQDWHPPNHGSFASNNPGKQPFDMGELGGVPQVMWPDHCVQGTTGADFHPDFLHQSLCNLIIRKGKTVGVDSYSAFHDNAGRNSTGLASFLVNEEVDEIYVCGLAADYCVKATALDCIMLGYKTYLLEDACRGVEAQEGDVEKAINEMVKAGVVITSTSNLQF